MLQKVIDWATSSSTYWLLAEEAAKFFFSGVVLAGLVTLFQDWLRSHRLKRVRRRAAQFLWSQAFTAIKIQQDIDIIKEGKYSEEEKQTFISNKVFALKAAATMLQNFVQDHASILPEKSFLHTSLLRMNGQFAFTLGEVLEDERRSSNERLNIFLAYTFQDNESGTAGTMKVGLKNIGEFFVRAILPIATVLGMKEPPNTEAMVKALQEVSDD